MSRPSGRMPPADGGPRATSSVTRLHPARPPPPAQAEEGRGTGGEAPPRKVSVGPDDVFQPGEPLRGRWREHSFFAPILLVVLVSAALVYGGIVAVGLAWRLLSR